METLNKKNSYTAKIEVKTTADKALQSVGKVGQWWAKHFTGAAAAMSDTFTVTFGETYVDFRITEFAPGRKITWLVTDCNLHWQSDKKEWAGTEIHWEVQEHGDMATLTMTHVGLVPGVECYEMCSNGWNGHLHNSLRKLITTGKGQPE